jgi:hypothetical protein
MSVQIRPNQATKPSKSVDKPENSAPTRLQESLIQSKTTMVLLREFLLEFKEVLVTITMILFFLIGVVATILKIYG